MSAIESLQTFAIGDDQEAVDDFFTARGWGDGLPIVAPTPARVEAMLAQSGLDPDRVIGPVPVTRRVADVRSVAVNAVMAGCRSQHLRAVVALLEATLDPAFNLAGVQATTHPCAPMAVFGGPVVGSLGMNGGAGAFGPGNRSNAVIGRALRLVLLNIGGGTIGHGDKATFGQPSKYTYAVAENSAANPWSELREDHGLDAQTDAVTVFAAEEPHNVNDHGSKTAEGILVTVAGTLTTLGNNNLYLGGSMLVVFGPEHAEMCAREGMTKQDVRNRLFELSHIRAGDIWWENRARFARIRPEPFAHITDDDLVPVVNSPDRFEITVFGGPGRHSVVIPTFGASEVVTRPLEGARP